MFTANRANRLFFGSLIFGVILWLLIFLILPVNISEQFHFKTFLFIACNYIALVIGFVGFRFKPKESKKHLGNLVLPILIGVLLLAFVLRWIDLFYVRELSFGFETKVNRVINEEMSYKSNIIFLLASVVKGAYFFPFIITLYKKNSKRIFLILSGLLMFLPVIEAVLRGNRKPFFEIFLIIIIGFIASGKLKIGMKQITISIIALLGLMIISMIMVFDRESLGQNQEQFKLIEARYGEILQMKPEMKEYILDENVNRNTRMALLSGMHFGQYTTHGVFEFNHIIKNENLPVTYGAYSFNIVPKIWNKLQITEKIPLTNPSPRKYVYLTTFGGFYIDFRWFSLIIMFSLGIAQKYCFIRSGENVLYQPIVTYFILLNFTFIILNYIRGAGTYPIVSILLLLFLVKLIPAKK